MLLDIVYIILIFGISMFIYSFTEAIAYTLIVHANNRINIKAVRLRAIISLICIIIGVITVKLALDTGLTF